MKSTVFFVDKSDDGGPILVQSASLPLSRWDAELRDIRRFIERTGVKSLEAFRTAAQAEEGDLYGLLKDVCTRIQVTLRTEGDWQIYPFAVHDLIGKGRVALDGRTVYIDGVQMPEEGWQVDKYGSPRADADRRPVPYAASSISVSSHHALAFWNILSHGDASIPVTSRGHPRPLPFEEHPLRVGHHRQVAPVFGAQPGDPVRRAVRVEGVALRDLPIDTALVVDENDRDELLPLYLVQERCIREV